MTGSAFLLLAMVVVLAAVDWIAVAMDHRRVEFVLKPLVMVGLISVALSLNPVSEAAQVLIVLGLLASLVGDVALMLPSDRFLIGLGAFFVAHVLYIVGLTQLGLSVGGLILGLLLVAVGLLLVGRRIIGAASSNAPALTVPVASYVGVISLMVVVAVGTGSIVAGLGALAFYMSDALLGWTRFVAEIPQGRTAVMVTYHLGQTGLVLALI